MRDTGLIPEPVLMQSMREDNKMETAAAVVFEEADGKVSMRSETVGASIAYAIASGGGPQQWQLYSKPVSIPSGKKLYAKACRLGFKDSKRSTFKQE